MIKVPNINWRTFYLLTILFRFYFATQESYIHPDEHFQSFEIVSHRILGYSTNIPWEFQSENPARSIGILYLLYGPLLYLIKFLDLGLTPIQIWYCARLQLAFLTWTVTDYCLYWMLPTKPERIKAIFFTLTSYITLVYQSHLFSNSFETILVLLSLLIIDDLRYILETTDVEVKQLNKTKSMFILGGLISIGIFNRVTFPVFLILPSWYILKYILQHPLQLSIILLGFIIPTILLIIIDTISFGKQPMQTPFDISHYTITPLNNLIYNTNVDNLSKHGIHPYYTHLLINLPILLGPGIFFLLINRTYWKAIPFLSLTGAVIFLSAIPHQELRFLMPIVPLACCCFDFTSKYVRSWMLYTWYIFNTVMCLLMGIFHQGGVVPAMDYLRENGGDRAVQIWWKTYSPPSWVLGNNSTQTILIDGKLDMNKRINIIDAMGNDFESVEEVISGLLREDDEKKLVYLVAPMSLSHHINQTQFKLIWNSKRHIDMDHLNFTIGIQHFTELDIYQLL